VRKAAIGVLERYLQATSGLRLWPDVLIIGTQRGGTTSLYRYLAEHPNFAPALVSKGVHYFDTELYERRPASWYRGHFPTTAYRELRERISHGKVITGEGSPYYMFHPLGARRVRTTVPMVKLIALLRNPVARAYSHYQHEVDGGFEDLPSFERALAAEEKRLEGERERLLNDPMYRSFAYRHHSYQARGRYAEQLAVWLELFPREQVLVLRSEDLFADPEATFAQVLRFLGLPSHTLRTFKRYNAHGAPRGMAAETAAELEGAFEAPNRDLERLLGRGFGWDAGPA
jgi:Sulfotransferase domain